MALLLVAILPSILYSGYWAVHTLPAEALEAAVPDHDHTGHNHVLISAGTGVWLSDGDAPLSLTHGLERPEVRAADLVMTDPLVAPVSPPPRHS